MPLFIKKVWFCVLVFALLFVLIVFVANTYRTPKSKTDYTLKAYKNTVALYDGETVIQIYNDIVLNTLPEKDIQSFKSGITFENPAQAELYLENFD